MTSPLQRYHNIMEQLDALSEARLELLAEIVESMERDGATEWSDPPFTAEITRTSNYDQRRLYPAVLELVPEAELIMSGAYVPEHDKIHTVEARVNVTKLKPFAKRGRAIKKLIEDAKDLGPPRLTVTKEGGE